MAKNKWVVFFTFALLTQEAFAAVSGTNRRVSSASAGGSSGVSAPITARTSTVTVNPTVVANTGCDEKSQKGYIPYSMLKALSQDGEGLSFERNSNGEIVLKNFGVLQNNCFDIQFSFQNLDDGSVGVYVQAIGKKFEPSAASVEDVTTYTNLKNCLKKDKKYDSESDTVNHENGSYVVHQGASFPAPIPSNKDKTTRLVYLSPSQSYGEAGGGNPDNASAPKCFTSEKMNGNDSFVLNRGVEFKLQEIAEACKAKEIRKIVQMRAGNSAEIQNTISGVIDALILEQAETGKDSSLIHQINKSGADLASFKGTREDLIDEADKYLKLVNKWHSEVTEPALMRIAELTAQAKDETDEAKKKVLRKQIEKLKKAIGTLDGQLNTNYRSIRDKLRDEGLGSRGMEFYEARVKSLYFGKVGEKIKGKDVTISTASELIAAEMKKEEPNFKDWDDTYAVKNGDKAPLEEAMRQRSEITSELQKKYKDYQLGEQKLYKQNCTGFFGPANPVRCRYLMENKAMRDKNFMSRVYPSQQSLIRLEGNIGSWYNMYQQWGIQNEIAESELAIFGNDPSFNFTHEGQFRQQQQGFDAYNPAYYQMMQQQGMQQGGQQQNYMPMMVN